MGAGASTAIDADARRTEDQWLRELGRAVLDVPKLGLERFLYQKR